jgi:hypothetical protein
LQSALIRQQWLSVHTFLSSFAISLTLTARISPKCISSCLRISYITTALSNINSDAYPQHSIVETKNIVQTLPTGFMSLNLNLLVKNPSACLYHRAPSRHNYCRMTSKSCCLVGMDTLLFLIAHWAGGLNPRSRLMAAGL